MPPATTTSCGLPESSFCQFLALGNMAELFRTGRPIEAPSVEALAAWDVDLEDDQGGIEEL